MTEPAKTPYPDQYLLFLEYFNKRHFFSAQNLLGELWLQTAGTEKEFYSGLVQLAVSLYHVTEGNPDGAKKAYATARNQLGKFGERFLGIDLAAALRQADDLFSENLTPGTIPPQVFTKFPKLAFKPE